MIYENIGIRATSSASQMPPHAEERGEYMGLTDNTITKLIETAFTARLSAYAPYSGYKVGAALLAENGRIFSGCNIENASYGGTVCAERVAVFKAVSEGQRYFTAIAIVGGKSLPEPDSDSPAIPLNSGSDSPAFFVPDYAYPCGMCRQVLSEFCEGNMKVIVARSVEDYREYTLEELIPHSFGPGMLKNDQN